MIIEAKHNKAALLVFNIYLNRLIKKNFSHFFLANLPPELPKDKSLIITPNHFSWWDGFFIHQLNKKTTKRKLYVMMLQKQLERYWFFKHVGAYSINQEKPTSISESVNYTSKILSHPDNAVAFYPQGEIEPFGKRPINLKKGLHLFLKNLIDKCVVLPVAFKIQHYNEKQPAIVFRSGRIISPIEVVNDFSIFENEFVGNIEALNEAAFKKNFVKDIFKGSRNDA